MSKPIYKVLGKRGRITIPFEFRQSLGYECDDIISFVMDGDRIILKREKLCDGCNGSTPIQAVNSSTLQQFLDNLSLAEQRAALIYLSVKWSESKEVLQRNV